MTLAATAEFAPAASPRFWDRHFRAAAGFSLALLVLTIPAAMLDERTIDGVGVWTKPLKFQISLALHFATLAFFATRLSPDCRTGRWMTGLALTAVASLGFELGYMMLQAAQAEPSHFNDATPFHAAMYALMGVGATLLVAAAAGVGVLVARDAKVRLGPGARAGAAIGLVGGAVATFVLAGYMSGNGGHHVGVEPDGAAALPIVGWSTTVGDLRPAHFLALHAMQILPAAGWLFDRLAPASAIRAVWLAAILHLALTLAVFVQALAGRPLIQF